MNKRELKRECSMIGAGNFELLYRHGLIDEQSNHQEIVSMLFVFKGGFEIDAAMRQALDKVLAAYRMQLEKLSDTSGFTREEVEAQKIDLNELTCILIRNNVQER